MLCWDYPISVDFVTEYVAEAIKGSGFGWDGGGCGFGVWWVVEKEDEYET